MLIKRIFIDLDYPFIDYKWDAFIKYIQNIVNLNIKDIQKTLFDEYYYFFLIGKINFKTYFENVVNGLNINSNCNNFYEKVKNLYKDSLIINKNKIEYFKVYWSHQSIVSTFFANIDEIHYKKIVNFIPEFVNFDYFIPSYKVKSTTVDYLFFEKILENENISENPDKILYIDNNIDSLLIAKEYGFLTLFYDYKVDLCNLISKYVLEY